MNYLSQLMALQGDEVVPVLEKATLFGGMIFQQGVLHMQTCTIRKMEIKDGKLVMQMMGEHRLDGLHALCVNFAYRNLTFRLLAYQFTIHADKIICHIPHEAKAIEARPNGERHVLPLSMPTKAVLHRVEKRISSNLSEVQIVDVSKSGLGVYLLGCEENLLQQYDHVWIREIGGIKLATPIFCRVEYVNQRRYLDSTVLRVGLSADRELPDEVYLDLVKKCRLVLSA